MHKYDVIGLGGCGVDLRVHVPQLPKPDHKVISEEGYEVSEGGVTSDNLVQCAKLGLKTAWVGTLGDDNWADHLLKKFVEVEVETPNPIKLKDVPTQQFWIAIDPTGNNSMVGIPGATRKLTPGIAQGFKKEIQSAQHFHTEVAVIPISAALEGARIAKENGVKTLLDIDGDPNYLITQEGLGTKEELKELLSLTDVVKLSRPGLEGLVNSPAIDRDTLNNVLEMGPKIVVVTQAEQGCVIADQEQMEKIDGLPVVVKDTVGAGDAFMGGLSYAFLQEWDLKKVGEFANACGAFKCTQLGTRASGTLEQINHHFPTLTI